MKIPGRIHAILYVMVYLSQIYCQCTEKTGDLPGEKEISMNNPILMDNFDSAALNYHKWGLSFYPLNDGIHPEIVSSPTRAGTGALKQTVRYMWNGEQNSNRCEIQGYRQTEPNIGKHIGYFQRFDETWIGFSIYLPSESWGPDNRSREVIFQLHGSADPGEPSRSPPLSLKVDLGSTECFWQVRWDENLISNSTQPSGPGAGAVSYTHLTLPTN